MNELLGWYGYDAEEDEDDVESSRLRVRSVGDSSGPECSDSGVGPWCGWCSRPLSDSGQTTGAFCSDLCFAQSRRASFKRNRMCDWCRHVRHTVAHVDVRDGSRHLQFCGDKCLNQYKMHIFCRETQAHLELHPHSVTNSDSSLITPELWLKDCKDKTTTADRQMSPPVKSTRRKFYSARRNSGTKRTHTVIQEVPQDLRVRPRSPVEPLESNPPPPLEPRTALPPPVTVLVPYPIIIPVPIPLPIPIPISLSDEILRHTDTTRKSTTPEPIDVKTVPRTLRKRKRPPAGDKKNPVPV